MEERDKRKAGTQERAIKKGLRACGAPQTERHVIERRHGVQSAPSVKKAEGVFLSSLFLANVPHLCGGDSLVASEGAYERFAVIIAHPLGNLADGNVEKQQFLGVFDARNKVIDIALAEVGYLEKKDKNNLDSKTGNAGDKNYTKYARDLDAIGFYNGRKQSVTWCDVFVDWDFVQAYGVEAALALIFQPTKASQNCGAGCKYSRQYYDKNGRLFSTPEPGDQIFFYSSDKSSISHTGLVYDVDKTYIYTVEGNTSGANGVVANGGGVCKKKYKLTNARTISSAHI